MQRSEINEMYNTQICLYDTKFILFGVDQRWLKNGNIKKKLKKDYEKINTELVVEIKNLSEQKMKQQILYSN